MRPGRRHTPLNTLRRALGWFAVLLPGCAADALDPRLSEVEVGGEDFGVATALAANIGQPMSAEGARFADLAVPHTEVMISDYAHGCEATSNTGRSLYIELFSSASPQRLAVVGKYGHWQPSSERAIPSDARFVAVLSETTTSSRSNRLAHSGSVEVVDADDDHITLKFDFLFEDSSETRVSGSVTASGCGAWEHSWLGIPRTNPAEPRN